jgi:cysteine desulfurase
MTQLTLKKGVNSPIYLDYQATTPMDPRVLEVMMPYFMEEYGNPHSRNHSFGWNTEDAVEKARKQIADLIGANEKDMIFTSGATESINLALKGVMQFYKQQGKDHLVISTIEHKATLGVANYLEENGFKVTKVGVDVSGVIKVEDVKKAITPTTALVSIMAINNEIGTIQPIKEIGALCRQSGVFFHTDAAQAYGKYPLNVDEMNIDLMSISGHKIYGPKGIGALYIRRKPRVRVLAQMHGGDQERGLRSGTLPVALCVGLGKAAEIAQAEMQSDAKRILELRELLYTTLEKSLTRIYVNGDFKNRLYNNLNISFAGVEGESLLMGFNKDIAVSSGSACTSASLESSYVLKALGVEDDLAHTSIRFGLGKFSTREEVLKACEHVIKVVNKLRAMSPIWDLIEAGVDLSTIQWAEH